MKKVYLTDNKEQGKLLRKLITVANNCFVLRIAYGMTELSEKEKNAINIVKEYADKNFEKQLKSCSLFCKISEKELSDMSTGSKLSSLIDTTVGTCCVLEDETQIVLAELQKLNLCPVFQKALQTCKSVAIKVSYDL